MDHARDNVFAGAAFAMNEHRDVRPCDLAKPVAKCTHHVGASENYGIRGHFAEGLNQRVDWIGSAHSCPWFLLHAFVASGDEA